MPTNPFGDDAVPTPRPNPFGEDEGLDPMKRLEGAPARIRALRAHVGAEGLTGVGMRQLMDELSTVLEAIGKLIAEKER